MSQEEGSFGCRTSRNFQSSSGYVTGEPWQPGTDVGGEDQVTLPLPATPNTPMQGTMTFEDNQNPDYRPRLIQIHDHNYAEFFVNGRYIDINHNEIGYVPPSTQGIQQAGPAPVFSSVQEEPNIPRNQRAQFQRNNSEDPGIPWNPLPLNRWAALTQPWVTTRIAPTKPPRTFATLLESSDGRSPDLKRQTSMGRLRESGTQVPVYVMDQSVQTSCWDNGKLVTTVAWRSSCTRTEPVNVTSNSTREGFDMSAGLVHCNTEPKSACPDLSFMSLPFKVPQLLPHVPPFPVSALVESQLNLGTNFEKLSSLEPRLDGHLESQPRCASPSHSRPPMFAPELAVGAAGLPSPPPILSANKRSSDSPNGAVPRDRDSGLGSSGPSHIQDWESLAALLPKDVVQTCSFFRANSQLLGCSQRRDDGNSIDKPVKNRNGRPVRMRSRNSRKSRPLSEPVFDWLGARFESIREEDGESSARESEPLRGPNCACSAPLREPCGARGCHFPSRACSSCPCCPPCCSSWHHHHHHFHYPFACHVPPHRQCSQKRDASNGSGLRRWHGFVNAENCKCSDSECSDVGETWETHPPENSAVQINSPTASSSEDEEQERREMGGLRRIMSLGNVRGELRRNYVRGGLDSSFLLDDSPREQKCRRATTSLECVSKYRPCATCYKVRSPTLERPPFWIEELKDECFCDCQTSDILEELEEIRKKNPGLCEEQMLRNTSLYREKKSLVDGVARACDSLVNAFSRVNRSTANKVETEELVNMVYELVANSLCPALEKVLSDGMRATTSIWQVVKASAILGPATKSIHELVSDLSGWREDSTQLLAFVNGLLKLHSLDCWLSYLVLKDSLLAEHYEEAGFVRRATRGFRSLFTELLMGLQSLSLLPFGQLQSRYEKKRRSLSLPPLDTRVGFQRELNVTFLTPGESEYALLPTRLPSDSRVPKSSSIPSRLCSSTEPRSHCSVDSGLSNLAKPSRIPVLRASPTYAGRGASPTTRISNS